MFQSSFELTGYITNLMPSYENAVNKVSKLFRAYGLYNFTIYYSFSLAFKFQSSFELTGYITLKDIDTTIDNFTSFKALSSLRVI